jgi:hypothetical protein
MRRMIVTIFALLFLCQVTADTHKLKNDSTQPIFTLPLIKKLTAVGQ